MEFEKLLQEADDLGIPVTEKPFKTYDGRIKNDRIYLRKGMTSTQKSCVLAEELGHYHTTVGDILDQQDVANQKQERRARIWAYNKLVSLFGIIKAYNAGCRNLYEMAEYLEVTEEFLKEALDIYKTKYGTCVRTGEYIIFFIPTLSVMNVHTKCTKKSYL